MEGYFYDIRIKFDTAESAYDMIDRLIDAARRYGYASQADLYEYCKIDCGYTANKFGWSIDMLRGASVIKHVNHFTIKLPASKPIDELERPTEQKGKITYRYYCSEKPRNTKPTSAPQPDILSITIHTNEVENPDEIISDVFKHISQIKDRMINITIM